MSSPQYIIFGATGGIGSALARQLAGDSGAGIFLVGHDPDRTACLAGELHAPSTICDVTDSVSVDQAMRVALEKSGGQIHGVANCTGSLLLKPAHITTDEQWAQTLAINLTGSFHILRAALKAMMSTGGSIVLSASAAARIGLPHHEAIAAAKAGVIGLMQSAAASYAPRSIRVNAVAPGMTQTPLTASIIANENALKASIALHPLGRIGQAAEIARAYAWLLSPENSWVSGQVIGVDGGLSTLKSLAKGS